MEGISHEACSLAGTLGLGKLIALYDDNGISIDGKVEGWFTDDTPKRFEAYGWHVIRAVDGHDVDAVDAPSPRRRSAADRPTLICCKTVIGKGAPNKAGTHDVHGAPLGRSRSRGDARGARLDVPAVRSPGRAVTCAGTRARAGRRAREADWRAALRRLSRGLSGTGGGVRRRMAGELPADWFAALRRSVHRAGSSQGRDAWPRARRRRTRSRRWPPTLPELLGGSADLTGSNLTDWQGEPCRCARGQRRQLHQLRRARVRHGGDHERHGAARRAASPSAAPSSCSPTTRATRSAWRR